MIPADRLFEFRDSESGTAAAAVLLFIVDVASFYGWASGDEWTEVEADQFGGFILSVDLFREGTNVFISADVTDAGMNLTASQARTEDEQFFRDDRRAFTGMPEVLRYLARESQSSSIGGRIESERKRLGLRQAELAEQLGLSQGTISRWETNSSVPEGKTLRAMRQLGLEV